MTSTSADFAARHAVRAPQIRMGAAPGDINAADAAVDELLDDIVRVVADVLGIAVGDDPAVVKHDNAVADLVGALHVVRDDDAGSL